jgi:hypothetical protein
MKFLFTIVSLIQSTEKVLTKASKIENENWFLSFIDKNPTLLITILTGLILPLGLVYLNNRNNIKLKTIENKLLLETKKLDKELDEESKKGEIIKGQERMVYASLSKILFDVQQLHVSLSGTCIDKNCIDKSLEKFDNSISKYHEEIANNMLYMPSRVINQIYDFYSKISDLKVSLKEFNDLKEYEMAHVSVYMHSIELSEILIDIQAEFISKDEKLKSDFDKSAQEMMKYCCGRKPPKEDFEKFMDLYKKVNPNLTNEEIETLNIRFGGKDVS